MFLLRALLAGLLLSVAIPASAAVRFVKWNANGSGDERNVAALDLSTGKVRWEKKLPKEVNFVLEVAEGVLVGNDDGNLYLLRAEDGGLLWKASLGKEVNELHREMEEGFFVSHDKQVYWLVGRDGKIKGEWK